MVRQASICLTQILYSDSLHVWAHSKQFMFGLKDFFYPFFSSPCLCCCWSFWLVSLEILQEKEAQGCKEE